MTGLDWGLQAACRTEDPALFFGEDGEPAEFRDRRETRAKAVCARCPARPDCLDFAMHLGLSGIWGGLDERERGSRADELGIPRWCASGEHQLTGTNVYVNPEGHKVCRACRNEADRRSRARRAEAQRAERQVAALCLPGTSSSSSSPSPLLSWRGSAGWQPVPVRVPRLLRLTSLSAAGPSKPSVTSWRRCWDDPSP